MFILEAKKMPDGSVIVGHPSYINEDGVTMPMRHLMQFDKYRKDKPTKRNKYIMYNCYKYRLLWA